MGGPVRPLFPTHPLQCSWQCRTGQPNAGRQRELRARLRIVVAGGTGIAGRYTMQAAEKAGHEAVALSRRRGVDLTTGAGLDAALQGVEDGVL
jgi:hypothetical protein